MIQFQMIRPPFPGLFSLAIILSVLVHSSLQLQTSGNICEKIHSSISKKQQGTLKILLQQLEQQIYEPCILQLAPKYYWAQNMTHLLVKFQFLNSADTSACDQVLWVNKNITHDQFSISLVCLQSVMIIRYRIKVKTFMPMNYYHAVWKTAQQNTIILQTPKSPNPYFWKNLYQEKHKPLRKPKIWWKIMQKYQDNLKKFIYDLEVQQGEDDISHYVKRNKKSKKSKYGALYNPESNKYLYCNQNNPFQLGSWL